MFLSDADRNLNLGTGKNDSGLALSLNPAEFLAKWTIPTVPRKDSTFSSQSNSRGDIWGATCYLVYEAAGVGECIIANALTEPGQYS